jgi:predicted phage terminase large subunit-like protein
VGIHVTVAADPIEYAARAFEPKPRRYETPGALARALDPLAKTSPALDLIDGELVELAEGRTDHNALAIFMPPQEGKSQRVSRRFAEWLLDHDPTLRIAIVSYELDLAVRWGRDIKQDVALAGDRLGISIRRDSAAAGRWETYTGGGVYCVGIGGPLTGRPVDILIVDDPVKDRAAAESAKVRESTWDWWESVALTRLAPDAKVVLIQTRWHEDDLAGRLAVRPSPLDWKALTIPAIAGDTDPLGRAPGEELPSVRGRAPGYFRRLQAGMSPYVFAGVYQQNPVAPEGNFFRRATFRYWRQADPWADGRERLDLEGLAVTLTDAWRFMTVDVAASVKTSADFTCAAVWAMSVEGELILLDRRRARVPEHDHFKMVGPLRERWGADVVFVERGFFATTLVDDARAAGVPVAPLEADADKVTRAVPAAGRLHAGRVWFPAETSGCECGNCPDGVWLDEWCDELAAFDKGAHDDQVDTFSYAARVATARWVAPKDPPRKARPAAETAVAVAHRSATGDGKRDLDIMNVPY